MEKNTREEYEKLKKKYDLPDFDILDDDFDIAGIEECSNVLRCVRERIAEKVEKACQMLEEILQPDTTVSNLYESRVFSEDDKKPVFELYSHLMSMKRRADALYILNIDSQDADFIRETNDAWKKIKQDIVNVLKKLQDSWSKEVEVADRLAYFG